MEKFTKHKGVAAPLNRSNIDTDQIIPAVYLKSIKRTGFEDALFEGWRTNEEDFILNRDTYRESSILVAGPDFGTGSSREHAVWALKDYGFKAVLSSKFADIFRGNSGKQGLLTAVLDQLDIEDILMFLDANPGAAIEVDLERKIVITEDADEIRKYPFEVDDYIRHRLLNGLDDIGITLSHEADIEAFEASRPNFKPKTLPSKTLGPAEVLSAHYAD